MKKALSIFIPGLLLAATGVGAGDLLTGSLAGQQVGLILVIAPILGAILKFSLNESLARWQIATEKNLLEGWLEHFGKFFHLVFMVYLFIWSYYVGGALINACGVAMDAIYPLGDSQAGSKTSKVLWGIIQSIIAIVLVLKFNFDTFTKFISFLVGLMFVGVIVTSIALFPNGAEWAMAFEHVSLDANTIKWGLACIGGVGGTLTVLSYGYWMIENKRLGKDGLKESRLDLTAAYLLTGLFSVAMIILGSKTNLAGVDKQKIALTLSEQISLVLGTPGKWLFLFGFFGGVFSSLLGVLQSVPYLFSDYVHIKRNKKVDDLTKTKEYKYFVYFIGIIPISTLYFKLEAIQLFYAITGALFMPFLAISLLILNNRINCGEFKNGILSNTFLSLTLALFVWVGYIKFF